MFAQSIEAHPYRPELFAALLARRLTFALNNTESHFSARQSALTGHIVTGTTFLLAGCLNNLNLLVCR